MTLYKERYLLEDPTQLVSFNLMDKPNLEPIPAYGYRYIFEAECIKYTLKYHADSLEFATAYRKMVKAQKKMGRTTESMNKHNEKYLKNWKKVESLSHVILEMESIG